MEKRAILFAVLLSLVFFRCSFVGAFGYSSAYTMDNPLTVYPGETKDAKIELITTQSDGSLIAKGEMLDSAGIAELIGNLEYKIEPEKPAVVNIRLKVPENASFGEHQIKMRFTDITPSTGEGTVGFKGGMVVSLKASVTEKPREKEAEEEKINLLWIILGIIVVLVAAVIYLILKYLKKWSKK